MSAMTRCTVHPHRPGGRPAAARLALALAAGSFLVLASPGTAAAADRSHPDDVVPIVDCVTSDRHGTWTAVFGYDNRTGVRVTIPVGPGNQVLPATNGDPQPTSFDPGVHHGAFVAVWTRGGGAMWHLGSVNLTARKTDTACSDATELPADGNGTGTVIALGAAAAVGVGLLARARRRPSSAAIG
jgi:hypothetical protein